MDGFYKVSKNDLDALVNEAIKYSDAVGVVVVITRNTRTHYFIAREYSELATSWPNNEYLVCRIFPKGANRACLGLTIFRPVWKHPQ